MKKFQYVLVLILASFVFVSCAEQDDDKTGDNGNTNGDSTGSNENAGGDSTGSNENAGDVAGAKIEWCKVTYAVDSIAQGSAFEAYSEIYVPGVTGKNGTHTGIKAQFGYSAVASAENFDSLTWGDVTRNEAYNGAAVENHDEYMTKDTIIPDSAGDYAISFRYSTDNGSSWTYCDKEGVASSFNVANLQKVKVAGNSGETPQNPGTSTGGIEWCQITWPTTDYTAENNEFAQGTPVKIYAQVYAPGITGQNGTHTGIQAKFGYVVSDINSGIDDVTWVEASYNSQFNGSGAENNDEYMIAEDLTLPVGNYVAFYLFSTDGNNWVGCDGKGMLTMDSLQSALEFTRFVFFGVK